MPTVLRCRFYGGEPADKIIIAARQVLDRARPGRGRALLHAEIAYALITKRVPGLAAREADAAVAAWPEGSLGIGVRGWLAMQFDRRDDARDAYRAATGLIDPARGWLGLARVAYITGDFDGAQAALAEIGAAPRYHVARLRLAADIARVRGDWTGFLTHIEEILAATPDGDHRRNDLLDRASALCAMDRRDDGVAIYRALWREVDDDGPGRFAREVLNHVDRGATGARVMLPKFPTVTQKRNYCGPATLELVLRSLGIDVDQDAIAPTVKRERGSSILAMTRYLEQHGLVTRRFEGNAARFGACIAQGLPVIVEEEYSTTSHVAVVIGVDESLGLLFVQDPMTHVTSERQLQTQTGLGAMYRNAAIVAIRAEDDVRLAALDAAGVVDGAHLRLIDSCADDEIAKDSEEVLRRCDRALALVEDYPLAWYRRTQTLMSQFFRFRAGTNQGRFVTALRKARVRYHDQEWPHRLHATYLMDDGRHEEALIELEHALRIDRGDSNTAQDIAECHMAQHRDDEAALAYWKTLTIEAGHVRATENFASHALAEDDLELAAHLSACALELAPDNPFNHVTASRIAQQQDQPTAALAHARQAIAVAPDYVWGPMRVAEVLHEVGTPEADAEAAELYLGLVEKRPYWFEPRWRGARELERQGHVEQAAELLLAGLEIAQDEPVVLVTHLTQILLEAGDDARAIAIAGQYARQRPTSAMLEKWWDTLDAADEPAAAREATAAFLASNPDSPFANAERASRLIGLGGEEDATAERLLRHALEGSPTYGWARRQLAGLLFRDRPDEAVHLLAAAPSDDDLEIATARASYLADLERHDEARALLPWHGGSWREQEVWNRVVLAGEPAAQALARTRALDAPSAARRDRRAVLAFAVAAEDWALCAALFDALPADDAITQYMAHAAATVDPRWRPEVERRTAARLARRPEPSTRRYLEAVRDGNRAALGDRAGFDATLARERNVTRLDNLLTTVPVETHPALVRAVRERLAAFPHRALGALAPAELAFGDGDYPRAAAGADDVIARFPRHGAAHALRLHAALQAGDRAGARLAAARAAVLIDPWVHVLELRAAVALLDGDRAGAAALARRAQQKAIASGYGPRVHAPLAGVAAVLAGDRAALAAARARAIDPDGGLWTALAAS